MGLITLVYVSFTLNDMDDDELRALLQECRDNNARLDVTGMLLYRDGFFIQALEGEEAVVKDLYAHIAKDPRHKNALTVYQAPIEKRSFENWSMGFNKIEVKDVAGMTGFTDFLENPEPEFFRAHPGHASELLMTFRDRIYF